MDLELLDELEDKVDVAVHTVNELKVENELLKEETKELESKIHKLTAHLETVEESRQEASLLKVKCEDLESKLSSVRNRIQELVAKMKALES